MKICYRPHTFQNKQRELVELIDSIMTDYAQQSYTVTVRQLFYQLLSRGVIENIEKRYKSISKLIDTARLAGMLDWDIEDRTRSFITRTRFADEKEAMVTLANQYHEDMWATQHYRPFVFIEKDALRGAIQQACYDYDVPLLSARGYPSSSVLHDFAKGALADALMAGQEPVLLYLGDHDPSGVNMPDSLAEKLSLYLYYEVEVEVIALTLDQVRELNPIANPAKESDKRYPAYVKKFGFSQCWELDALPPAYLDKLVRDKVSEYIDAEAWREAADAIKVTKDELAGFAYEC